MGFIMSLLQGFKISALFICLEADSYENCLICSYGYGIYTDQNGNQKCQNSQTNLPVQVQIIACEDGYVDEATSKCTANCGIGKYGQIIFDPRGLIKTSSCETCDDICFECSSKSECLSCKKGFYLYTGSSLKQTGQCLQKSGYLELVLYVDSVSDQYSEDLLTGMTLDDPFLSLQSAFAKAYEYGAPFESALIKILLIDSTNGYQVQVFYRLRDQFKFLVGAGLEIRNIAFNAFDSIFDPRQGFDLNKLDNYYCLTDKLTNAIYPLVHHQFSLTYQVKHFQNLLKF
ncbi:UNKNOWN [Stylonychia lemnae]|uniref:Uncharacterized protein n=1 Tax=Stylonychia lemnae TaxID=5949 RepID=A0A078B7P3_STYLE|nr:UNKNOWN [Stylonychia lemnae]|eukprot:CDW90246.1 UNKNOWN [Stylonychia lemnae]